MNRNKTIIIFIDIILNTVVTFLVLKKSLDFFVMPGGKEANIHIAFYGAFAIISIFINLAFQELFLIKQLNKGYKIKTIIVKCLILISCFVFIPYEDVINVIKGNKDVNNLAAYYGLLIVYAGFYFVILYTLFIKLLVRKDE